MSQSTFQLWIVYWKKYQDRPVIYQTEAVMQEGGRFEYIDEWSTANKKVWGYTVDLERNSGLWGCEGLIGLSLSNEGAEALRRIWIRLTAEKAKQEVLEAQARADKWEKALRELPPADAKESEVLP